MTEKVEEYAAGIAKLADAEGELNRVADELYQLGRTCLLYTSPSPRDS